MFDTGGNASSYSDAPRPDVDHDPHWLAALTDLFGADPTTGWMDTDAALEAMAWLARHVADQAHHDRGTHTRGGLEHQIGATAEISNALAAVQAIRMTQYAATTVDHAVLRATTRRHPNTQTDSDADLGAGVLGESDAEAVPATQTRWMGETSHHVGAMEGTPLTPADGQVHVGDTREVLHPLGYRADFADTHLGALLCLGPMQASRRLEEAIDAVTKTPRLLAEMAAGRLDPYRLAQVTRELVEAGGYTSERVEDELLARGATEWTSQKIGRRARSLVQSLDPAAARTIRKKRAKDAINVITRPGSESGTTEVHATVWTKDALAAFAAVEDLAKALHESTTTNKTLGECRADAMVDLILGNASVTTNATLLIPVKTERADDDGSAPWSPGATNDAEPPASENGVASYPESEQGADDEDDQAAPDSENPLPTPVSSRIEAGLEQQLAEIDWDREFIQLFEPPGPPVRLELMPLEAGSGSPSTPDGRSSTSTRQLADASPLSVAGLCDVEVPGIGFIPADVVQAMLRAVGTTITHSLVDHETGTLVSACTKTYRPTSAIRRFVVQRDRHCRFPTCTRDAKYCDVDHVTPWPRGETTPAGLQLLCRHHHRAKHEGGWQVTMTPDGTCWWVSPTGRTYITKPGLADIITDARIAAAPLNNTALQ